jgi:hypothetical protein
MKGGITPGIVRIPSSSSLSSSATWYLFNKERNNRPIFLKLFQNGTSEIVGEANLLGTAPQGFSYLTLSLVGASLHAVGEQNGLSSTWEIRDKGFSIPRGSFTITSINLNNYTNAEVPHVLSMGLRESSAGGAKLEYFVSNGGAWESLGIPNNQSLVINDHWFRDPHGKELKWKIAITPGRNPEYTPFLGVLDLDYEVKRQP